LYVIAKKVIPNVATKFHPIVNKSIIRENRINENLQKGSGGWKWNSKLETG
jgi:hypothetical protein